MTQHKRGLLTRAEHRLDDESSDGDGVLLRFTTEGDVNLTQIDGCQDDVNVIFDSAVGLQSWATLVDEPMTQVT